MVPLAIPHMTGYVYSMGNSVGQISCQPCGSSDGTRLRVRTLRLNRPSEDRLGQTLLLRVLPFQLVEVATPGAKPDQRSIPVCCTG